MDRLLRIFHWGRKFLVLFLAGYGVYMLGVHYRSLVADSPQYPTQFLAGTYEIGPKVEYSPTKLMEMCFRFAPYCSYKDSTWTLFVFTRAQPDESQCHLVIAAEGQDLAKFAIPGLRVQRIDGPVPPEFCSTPPPDQLAGIR